MTIDEVIKTLEQHNHWRKGADVEMIDPKVLGDTIDEAIGMLKIYKQFDTLRQHVSRAVEELNHDGVECWGY